MLQGVAWFTRKQHQSFMTVLTGVTKNGLNHLAKLWFAYIAVLAIIFVIRETKKKE